MSRAITTGPFRVPQAIVGTGNAPVLLIVNLKNPTNSRKKVKVIVEQSEPIFPVPVIPQGERCVVTDEIPEDVICDEVIKLDPDTVRQVYVLIITTTTVMRVTVKGDVDEDAEKVEVSVVGTDEIGNQHEPSMFFRHEDFVEVDND